MLGGPLTDRAWLQAAGPAGSGGLGLRRARDLRFPAFLASRAEARGLAEGLAGTMPARVREALFGWWESTSAAALEEWAAELLAAAAEFAKQLLEEAGARAALRAAQLAGHPPSGGESSSDEHARRAAAFLLHGPDDDEHPDHEEGLQSRLAALPARQQVEAVRAMLRQEGDHEGHQLLDDLLPP